MTLVSVVNDVAEPLDGPGVTLTLPGLLITGKIVPNWYWSQDAGERHRTAYISAGGKLTEDGHSPWSKYFDRITTAMTTRRDEQKAAMNAAADLADRYRKHIATSDDPSFIHLRDARIWTGATVIPSGEGTFWRGRLSDVVGWVFGELG